MSEDKNRLISFTDNYSDESSKSGFKFTFYCDHCGEGYKTRFIESKTSKKGGLFKGIGKLASVFGRLTGQRNVGYSIDEGTDVLSNKYDKRSSAWRKEHEKAFEKAQNEAKGHFHRCPSCTKWLCSNCWNEETDLCIGCSPREGVEVAKAKADKMSDEIRGEAEKTEVFTGDLDEKERICPRCGKPAGKGNYCNNCGAALELNECPSCGAENQNDTSFCSECGKKLK